MKRRENPHPTPIPGADPRAPHPIRTAWRGIGNIGLFVVESLAAFFELFRPPKSETELADRPAHPHPHPHPVEKSASFPIND